MGIVSKWPGGEESETHPSYGMARFSRRQGSPGRLFGSPVQDHQAYVTLTVARGECVTTQDTGWTRYYGGLRGDLIEVDMSAAQFAELLTSMNVGSGVPCTVRYLAGKQVEVPPDVRLEIERVREGFTERIRAINDQARQDAKEASDLLDKKTLTVAERKLLKEKLERTFREVDANTPYMLKLFEEASEKVVTHAKAEIDAFVAHNIITAGIRALAEGLATTPQPEQLPEGSAPDGK